MKSKKTTETRNLVLKLLRLIGFTEMDRFGHYHLPDHCDPGQQAGPDNVSNRPPQKWRIKVQPVSWRFEYKSDGATWRATDSAAWRVIHHSTFKSTTERILQDVFYSLQRRGIRLGVQQSSQINFRCPGMAPMSSPVHGTKPNQLETDTMKKSDIIGRLAAAGIEHDPASTVAVLKEQLKAIPAAAPAEAPAAAPAAAAVKDSKNGVTRPAAATKTGRVWELCDHYARETGSPDVRKAVLAQAETEGVNKATAVTQYGRWRTYNGLSRASLAAAAPTATEASTEAPPAPPLDEGTDGFEE